VGEIMARMAREFHRRGLPVSARGLTVLLALLLLLGTLAAVRLVLIAQVVVAARDLQQMRQELHRLRMENAALASEIAQRQFAPDLLRRAQEELGLQPAQHIEVVGP